MNQIKCTVAVKTSLFLLRKKKHSQGLGEQGDMCIYFRGTREQRCKNEGNIGLKMRGTGDLWQFWGTGNIENQHFCFWEQGNKAIYFRGTSIYVTSLGRPKKMLFC